MKTLILSVSAGQGHNMASAALRDYLESLGHEVNIIDTYKFLNIALGNGMDKGYSIAGRYMPKLNDNLYTQAERVSDAGALKTYMPYVFSDLNKYKMRKYLEKDKPDAIVCTHVFGGILITQLLDSGQFDPSVPVYGVLTDYSLHPFWEHCKLDHFVVANELLIPSVAEKGIDEKKILPFGIPVRMAFSVRRSREEACEKLGLDHTKIICMLSSGGRGFGALDQLALQADKLDNVLILAMTGTNALMKKKIEGMKFEHEVRAYGYVDNMDEFLDAADFIVGKPGGLSTQEALAKHRLMILTPPLPGVEDSNLAFLLNNSMAVFTNKHLPLNDVIRQLFVNEGRVEYIKEQIGKWAKPNSARTLGDYIIKEYEEGMKEKAEAQPEAPSET